MGVSGSVSGGLKEKGEVNLASWRHGSERLTWHHGDTVRILLWCGLTDLEESSVGPHNLEFQGFLFTGRGGMAKASQAGSQ